MKLHLISWGILLLLAGCATHEAEQQIAETLETPRENLVIKKINADFLIHEDKKIRNSLQLLQKKADSLSLEDTVRFFQLTSFKNKLYIKHNALSDSFMYYMNKNEEKQSFFSQKSEILYDYILCIQQEEKELQNHLNSLGVSINYLPEYPIVIDTMNLYHVHQKEQNQNYLFDFNQEATHFSFKKTMENLN